MLLSELIQRLQTIQKNLKGKDVEIGVLTSQVHDKWTLANDVFCSPTGDVVLIDLDNR